VVGLDGTGDQTSQTPFTVQSIRNMLTQMGITVPANVNPQLKNVAAVMAAAQRLGITKLGIIGNEQFIKYLEDAVSEPTSLVTRTPPMPDKDAARRLAALEPGISECKDGTFFTRGATATP